MYAENHNRIDEKTRCFADGFDKLAIRLRERYYTAVQDFSRDLAEEVKLVIARINDQIDASDADIDTIHNQLHEVKPGTAEHHALSHEQKEIKKLAKRLIKAVKEMLEDALKKEAELKGTEQIEALRKLDSMPIFAASKSIETEDGEEISKVVTGKKGSASVPSAVAGVSPPEANGGDTGMHDADEHTDEAVIHLNVAGKEDTIPMPAKKYTPASKTVSCASSSHENTTARKMMSEKPNEPLSPPISTDADAAANLTDADSKDAFARGGVPWYLAPFDPIGTTVYEERYTGREVLRDMTEELSDMDEDTLTELNPNSVEAPSQVTSNGKGTTTMTTVAKKSVHVANGSRSRNRRRR